MHLPHAISHMGHTHETWEKDCHMLPATTLPDVLSITLIFTPHLCPKP